MNRVHELREKVKDLKILIVDDEIQVLESTVTFFKKFFKNVEQSVNGKEALEIMENQKIDVLITDVKMPIMNGWELSNALEEKEIKAFIVILTGSPSNEVKSNGCDLLLSKPVQHEDLLNLMDKIIENKKL